MGDRGGGGGQRGGGRGSRVIEIRGSMGMGSM